MLTTFVGAIGFIVFLSLVYELTTGVSRGAIAGFYSYGAIVYLICLFILVAFSIYATLSKYNISAGYIYLSADILPVWPINELSVSAVVFL